MDGKKHRRERDEVIRIHMESAGLNVPRLRAAIRKIDPPAVSAIAKEDQRKFLHDQFASLFGREIINAEKFETKSRSLPFGGYEETAECIVFSPDEFAEFMYQYDSHLRGTYGRVFRGFGD